MGWKKKFFGDSNKGQITVFIILGIIILASASLFIFIQTDQIAPDETVFFTDTSSVNIFVEGCLSEVAEEGIFLIGRNGGYYSNENLENYITFNFADVENVTIPIYYDQSEETYLPSIEEIEDQLDLYVEDNLNECMSTGFESFSNQGWVIGGSDFTIESTIRDQDISLQLNYPLDIIVINDIITLQNFENTVDLEFMEIYSIIEETLEKQKENPNYIIIGSIGDLSRLSGFSYEIDYLGDDIVWYSLLFDQGLRSGYPFEWGFGVQYDWSGVFEE